MEAARTCSGREGATRSVAGVVLVPAAAGPACGTGWGGGGTAGSGTEEAGARSRSHREVGARLSAGGVLVPVAVGFGWDDDGAAASVRDGTGKGGANRPAGASLFISAKVEAEGVEAEGGGSGGAPGVSETAGEAAAPGGAAVVCPRWLAKSPEAAEERCMRSALPGRATPGAGRAAGISALRGRRRREEQESGQSTARARRGGTAGARAPGAVAACRPRGTSCPANLAGCPDVPGEAPARLPAVQAWHVSCEASGTEPAQELSRCRCSVP